VCFVVWEQLKINEDRDREINISTKELFWSRNDEEKQR
jgi:hypothetical protein